MPSEWTRRTFLAAGACGAMAAVALAPAPPAVATHLAGLADLRRRWFDLQLGSGYDPDAQPYVTRLRELGERAAAFRSAMTASRSSPPASGCGSGSRRARPARRSPAV